MAWNNTTDWNARMYAMSTTKLLAEIEHNKRKFVTPGVLEEKRRLTEEYERRCAIYSSARKQLEHSTWPA